MEDIRAFMESGVLELYVLGDVSPEERLQVEKMVANHPIVKVELEEIERSIEAYAEKYQIEPPSYLRGRVLNSILTNLSDDTIFNKNRNEPLENNIISIPAQKASNFYKYAFAACLGLLVASTIALVTLYNRLQQSNNQLAALQSDKQHYANQVNLMDQQLEVFHDASFKFLKLQGTPKLPSGSVTIAWSPVKHKVMIDMSSLKMPVNDLTHQYQLWAIVAGKPVDLGVFDKKPDSTDMKQMKTIAAVSADAFAVTLEPRGGSVNPTMDKMMVIGKF